MATEKMEFDQFMETASGQIKKYLPGTYQDAEISMSEVQKLNATYMSMQVKKPGQAVVASVNMNDFYEDYCQGADLEDILKGMAGQAQMEPEVDVGWVRDYGQVKDKLFIRVCDMQENQDYLNQIPHRDVDGLAVTYHIKAPAEMVNFASVTVTNDMLKQFGIPKEKLDADAVRNSQEIFPPALKDMNTMMRGLLGDEFGEIPDADMMGLMGGVPQDGPELYVLTNEENMFGAASMCYPGILQEAAGKIKSDLYVLPSSLHEVLLTPDSGNLDYHALESMVQEINETVVAPGDRLSDHVYHYDAKDQVLERAETFARRMEEKEAEKETARNEVARNEAASPSRKENVKKGEPAQEKDGRQPGRQSVLARLNQKKEEVDAQPRKRAPQRQKDMGVGLE